VTAKLASVLRASEGGQGSQGHRRDVERSERPGGRGEASGRRQRTMGLQPGLASLRTCRPCQSEGDSSAHTAASSKDNRPARGGGLSIACSVTAPEARGRHLVRSEGSRPACVTSAAQLKRRQLQDEACARDQVSPRSEPLGACVCAARVPWHVIAAGLKRAPPNDPTPASAARSAVAREGPPCGLANC